VTDYGKQRFYKIEQIRNLLRMEDTEEQTGVMEHEAAINKSFSDIVMLLSNQKIF